MVAGMKANSTLDNGWLEQELVERTASAERRAAQLRAFAAALTVSEQQERRRLAERLHGELQQLLTVAVMRLASARKKLGLEDQLRSLLDEVDNLIRESIDETRSLTLDLSPPILRHGTFARAMEWLSERMVETHGFRVLVSTDSELDVPSERVKVFLFDAVRELLFNSFKYSGVGEAEVTVRALGDELTIVVSDQGAGCDASKLQCPERQVGGFGLFSIRERLEVLGGRAVYHTAPGAGFRAELTVPLAAETAEATASLPRVTMQQAAAVEVPIGVIRVLLAEDHRLMRAGLSSLINSEPDLGVIAEAPDGTSAIELALRLRPDVIVMDVNMPQYDGTEATRAITTQWPEAKIIGLSEYADSVTERAMREAGASAYLYKDGPPENLPQTIRDLARASSASMSANPAV